MAAVITPKLYRMRANLPQDAHLAAVRAGIVPDKVYWLVSSRPSSLGGYLGHFEGTYEQALGVSPNGITICRNLPMLYVIAVGCE